jgi:hypothetical protein
VYQKEYLEFFCSPENKDKLLAQMVNFPTLSYHVVNAKGESVANTKGTAAVTWGVFPGKVPTLFFFPHVGTTYQHIIPNISMYPTYIISISNAYDYVRCVVWLNGD